MNNMNNFSSSTPDSLSSSKAIMGSGNDSGMYCRDGDEDSKYLRKNSTAVQERSNTLSNRPRWQCDSNIDNDIKQEKKEEEKEEEKEEKNEGKKEEKNEGKKEEKNEGIKGKKKRKKRQKKMEKDCRGAKSVEVNEPRDIFTSTPGSVSKLDEHSRTSQPLQKTSKDGKCVLDDKSQKNNSSHISYSSDYGRQNFLGQDSKEQRFISFPTKSKWTDKSRDRDLGLWELCGNKSLDLPSQVEAGYPNRNVNNQCANERNDATLSELSNLPDYICEHLDKNNRLGFHQITERDSLDLLDEGHIEYLDETFGITGIQPLFIDHSGLVIWFLDKNGNMYEWDEMQQNLQYMGKDLIDGLTNKFIYPENICVVLEDTGERIPVEEFNRQIEERFNRMISKNIC
ncbi:hypothetical protein C1645_828775 [Glomus cerebriforme]|uniref:Uncharacterized protein n=1 Tax=Glomus cerebriforme TaxID=658196 RepID=A0A397SVM1_9GLOM|nr:hypothetical protein C1645_828775 [Glomus cerebriforme]